MNLNKFIPTILLFTAPCFATSFTFGESIDVENEKELIDLVLENKDYCLINIEPDRIYLDPENLYPTKVGMFLRFDEFFLVKLPSVYSDDNGCYIKF